MTAIQSPERLYLLVPPFFQDQKAKPFLADRIWCLRVTLGILEITFWLTTI